MVGFLTVCRHLYRLAGFRTYCLPIDSVFRFVLQRFCVWAQGLGNLKLGVQALWLSIEGYWFPVGAILKMIIFNPY